MLVRHITFSFIEGPKFYSVSSLQALEGEAVAERRRLAALHQQRVFAHLAQRRRTALSCYSRSLRDTPPSVS